MIASGAIRLTVPPWSFHMREIISPLDGIRSPFGVARTGGGPTPPGPPGDDGILLENNTDFLMLEDGTSFLLQE